MQTTTTNDILDQLRPLTVTKGGAQTKFHPYKIDFVLRQLLATG